MNGYGICYDDEVIYECYYENGVKEGWGWEIGVEYVTKTFYKNGMAKGFTKTKYEDGETFWGILKGGIKEGLGETK